MLNCEGLYDKMAVVGSEESWEKIDEEKRGKMSDKEVAENWRCVAFMLVALSSTTGAIRPLLPQFVRGSRRRLTLPRSFPLGVASFPICRWLRLAL